MNFTAGLLLIFLNVFLPGLIFLRFYFVGEFSKQFNTRIPVVKLAFYSLIPGLLILSAMIWFYSCGGLKISTTSVLGVYLDLMSSEGEFATETTSFLNSKLQTFIGFNFLTYILSAFLGFGLHYLTRKFGFDKRFKLLRFKNQWYYIFSGEILRFKKFIQAVNEVQINNTNEKINVLTTYADILVEQNGESIVYTGYVVDYDLQNEDANQLEKLYLLDAHKKSLKNKSKKVKIPGDLFVIDFRHVQNMNLTYVPSINRKLNLLTQKQKRKKLWRSLFKIIVSSILALILLITLFNIPTLPSNSFVHEFGFWQKLLIVLFCLMITTRLFINNLGDEVIKSIDGDLDLGEEESLRKKELGKIVLITAAVYALIFIATLFF